MILILACGFVGYLGVLAVVLMALRATTSTPTPSVSERDESLVHAREPYDWERES